jgi:hypothetical protein
VLVVTHDAAVSAHVQRTIAIQDGRTSTEVLRQRAPAHGPGTGSGADAAGGEGDGAEEFAVLDRAGRLQLPRDFTDSLGMRDRVRLALETDHIAVWPGAAGRGDGGSRIDNGTRDGTGTDDEGGTHDGGTHDGGAHRRGAHRRDAHDTPPGRQEEK